MYIYIYTIDVRLVKVLSNSNLKIILGYLQSYLAAHVVKSVKYS